MDKIITNLESKPLSDVDISDATGVKVICYGDLAFYRTLDEVLGREGACVILFRVSPQFGHWTCIFRHNDKTVEWFDSLGMRPDDELKKTEKAKRAELGQDMPLLTKLIDDSPYRCIYNRYKLQKNSQDINTCGRWCIVRLALRDFGPKEFRSLFLNQSMPPDYYVSVLTAFI